MRQFIRLTHALALTASALSAQTPALPTQATLRQAALRRAAETITAENVAQHIDVITHDSIGRRSTPSPGLERTAQYIAAQFQKLGLTPMGKANFRQFESNRREGRPRDSTWIQRVDVPGQRRFDYGSSTIMFTTTNSTSPTPVTIYVPFATTARFVDQLIVPVHNIFMTFSSPPPRPVVLMAGRHTVASVQEATSLRDKIVLYVPPAGGDSAAQREVLRQLRTVAQGLIILSEEDSVHVAADVQAARQQPLPIADDYMMSERDCPWTVKVWSGGIQSVLTAAGANMTDARAANEPMILELPSLQVYLQTFPDRTVIANATMPNVVGLLEGSDSAHHQYLVFVAHMDQAVHQDSTGGATGADDNAPGIAGLLELARAFSQPGARPAHSIVFLATSGEGEGFAGSNAFLSQNHGDENYAMPAVTLNLDRLGRAGDSISIDGPEEMRLPITPTFVANIHPELHLAVSDTGTVFTPVSDHYVFASNGHPSLFIHGGTHAPRQAPDTSATIDAERQARILRLVFYFGEELASAKQVPQWNREARLQFLNLNRGR